MQDKIYSLRYDNINIHANEIRSYIDKRRHKKIKSLKTRWDRFNKTFLGGIEPNSIMTIAGITGSGKSSFVNSLETDLFELNPDIDFAVLNFSFEMIASRNVGRKLSYKLRKTTSELYSGNNTLSDNDFNSIEKEIEKIKQYPIYYVDIPGTVEQIRETILKFSQNEGKDKWIVVILDHTLLTHGARGEQERVTLANLERMFIEMKKYGRNTIIQLSQMNRQIESVDRINNRSMHYPMRTDIFGADSIMQASDIVVILHRPELLGIPDGMYGPKGFRTENLIYLHIIKNREGDLGLIIFENNLKYNRLDEININEPIITNNDKSKLEIDFDSTF